MILKLLRKLLIRFLTWLLNVQAKTEYTREKVVEHKEEIKFVSPFNTEELYNQSENITDFINKIEQYDRHNF